MNEIWLTPWGMTFAQHATNLLKHGNLHAPLWFMRLAVQLGLHV